MLREASILFGRNTITGTSSIAVTKATAAGGAVLPHPDGAIPETLGPFGFLEPGARLLAHLEDQDSVLSEEFDRQVRYARDRFGWPGRAREAIEALAGLAA